MRRVLLLFLLLYVSAAAPAEADEMNTNIFEETLQPAGELTLSQALAQALARNPELAAFSKEVGAADAARIQSEVFPNPVLEVRGENLGNDRLREDGDRATTLQLSQLIELGGKRMARIKAAGMSREVAVLDYEAKRLDVVLSVTRNFVDVLTAQKRLTLAEETADLAGQVLDVVAKRVLAGKVSPVEETRARLARATARVEVEQAERELLAARRRLAATWGSQPSEFLRAAGDLEARPALPALEEIVGRVRDNPDIARWTAETDRRRALAEAEKARAIPDVTVFAEASRFSQFNDDAYLVGISFPLPLFDRNRGGILEAGRRLEKAADEKRAAENRLLADLGQSYQRLSAIRFELETLESTILPGARSAFDAATKGYQLGKFGFLDVLDAQRTLFQARSQHLRALADYQRGFAEIERITGGAPEAPVSGNEHTGAVK